MTMPELLDAMNFAVDEARKRGADDADVDAIRRGLVDEHRLATTGQSYANEWIPPRQLPPERYEPEEIPRSATPRRERRGDRF